jgi:hypothetical protein
MIIPAKTDFYVPDGFTGNIHTIAPDSVIASTVKRYMLNDKTLRGLDPACGIYTIPRVLRKLGAPRVDASDIDPVLCKFSQQEADILTAAGLGSGTVSVADFLTLQPQAPYDFIFTSLPFTWFAPDHVLGPEYAQALARLLVKDGRLILDSGDMVVRDNKYIPVAKRQIDYFSAHGFELLERQEYEVAPVPGFDTLFIEIALRRL